MIKSKHPALWKINWNLIDHKDHAHMCQICGALPWLSHLADFPRPTIVVGNNGAPTTEIVIHLCNLCNTNVWDIAIHAMKPCTQNRTSQQGTMFHLVFLIHPQTLPPTTYHLCCIAGSFEATESAPCSGRLQGVQKKFLIEIVKFGHLWGASVHFWVFWTKCKNCSNSSKLSKSAQKCP